MARRFEELPAWQLSRGLVRDIYELTRAKPFQDDWGLCDQIQRAAVSVCSNIAEGHERGTTAELIQYLFFAKGSAGEVRSQLYHVKDLGYADPASCESLQGKAEEISRQLSAWIQSMQGAGFKGGPKYHKEPDRTMEKFWKGMGCVKGTDGIWRSPEKGAAKEAGK
jgi:four helix bundle protein